MRSTNAQAFSTWSYENDLPLSLEELRVVASKLPAYVYRAKGVVYTSDAPERRAVLQVVGKRVDLSLQDEWGERTPRTQIVVIGAAGLLDPPALRDQIEMAATPQRGHDEPW
jgi:G3E family GTPase